MENTQEEKKPTPLNIVVELKEPCNDKKKTVKFEKVFYQVTQVDYMVVSKNGSVVRFPFSNVKRFDAVTNTQ